jgi:transposase
MSLKPAKNRAWNIEPNDNISFPIGTIVAVKKYFQKLGLEGLFKPYKQRGRDISSLIQALVSYRLTENQSVTRAAEWINRKEVLETFGIKDFEQRTLYRILEILGNNKEEIMYGLQDRIFDLYEFPHTNINMDWTSIVLYGDKCPIGKRGYSREHRPDKKQITVGVSELASPINIPIGMTVREGNINDQVHFNDTFNQVIDLLEPGSMIVFDQGANRKQNLDQIQAQKMKYVTARQINKSDENTWIKNFHQRRTELVDDRYGVYGLKKRFPSRNNYLFFSQHLHDTQMESKFRKVDRLFKEAEEIQKTIEANRNLPKRYRINNPLVDIEYSYQTILSSMDTETAKQILNKACITGREGFFCLVSSENLTLKEVLSIYRQKDSIEKIFNSLKNELDIKPLRVWSDVSVYGALIIAFLSQLIMSMIRYDYQELKHTSVKFIRQSLMNLTVTIERGKETLKRMIFSNFDPISSVILGRNQAKT